MSNAAKSVFYFGFNDILLVFCPNPLLRLVNVPTTNEVWIHLAGRLLFLMFFSTLWLGVWTFFSLRKEGNLVPVKR